MDLRTEELPSSVISLCIYIPLRRGLAEYTLTIPSPIYCNYLSVRVCISALQVSCLVKNHLETLDNQRRKGLKP